MGLLRQQIVFRFSLEASDEAVNDVGHHRGFHVSLRSIKDGDTDVSQSTDSVVGVLNVFPAAI